MSRDITSLGLAYSIAKFIEDMHGVESEVIHTGIPSPTALPLCRVKNVPTTFNSLAKSRESIEVVYNIEILIFQKSLHELNKTKSNLIDSLLFDSIPYYTEDGDETNYLFMIDSNISEMPNFSNTIENVTSYHSSSLDVSVTVVKHKNKI